MHTLVNFVFGFSIASSLSLAALAAPNPKSDPAEGSKPNIIMVLIDDWGWANVGYHNSDPVAHRATPNIDRLAHTGVELDQYYAHTVCGPSRASLLSGRDPSNVNIENGAVTQYNFANPAAGGPGVPPNMTTISEKLSDAGYTAHVVGKWDAGISSADQIPRARRYNSSLILYNHMNDMWTMKQGYCGRDEITDLWDDDHPATDLAGTAYEEGIFKERLLQIIDQHNVEDGPLFLYYPARVLHTPLQVPDEYAELFADVPNEYRRLYYGMTKYLDEIIGAMILALKRRNMWENTVFVMSSDNGGPIYDVAGANNYPLRGGKLGGWQGGIRVNGFVNGGALPNSVRGSKREQYIHIADWYATFCYLAGVDPHDERAEAAGLRPVDSLNMWPLISGQTNVSPRKEMFFAPLWYNGQPESGYSLISGPYKILLGPQAYSVWTGPEYPNETVSDTPPYDCGYDTGCFYNIIEDPEERNDLSDDPTLQNLRNAMKEKAEEYYANMYLPDRGVGPNPLACVFAEHQYNGFWGPFADLPID